MLTSCAFLSLGLVAEFAVVLRSDEGAYNFLTDRYVVKTAVDLGGGSPMKDEHFARERCVKYVVTKKDGKESSPTGVHCFGDPPIIIGAT